MQASPRAPRRDQPSAPASTPAGPRCPPTCLQVTAESKFVDLGADSLDTVEIMMALEEK